MRSEYVYMEEGNEVRILYIYMEKGNEVRIHKWRKEMRSETVHIYGERK